MYTPVLQDEPPCSHVTTEGIFNLHRGCLSCTGGPQLTSRSEGRHTFLMSSLQMTLRKRVRTPKFKRRYPGSNSGPKQTNETFRRKTN